MTKNILLAATALSVMAFAGGAAAQVQITGAKVSGQVLGIDVAAGTTDSFYTVAAESNGTEANRTTTAVAGDNVIASALKTGVFDAGAAGTTYSATITLTGAVLANPLLNADVAVTGNTGTCVIAPATVVSGGAAGQNTATVVFTVPNSCSSTGANVAPNGVSFDVPFIKNTGTGGVSASISYGVSTTGAAFGGAAGSADLVQVLSGYSVYARANPIAGASARKLTTFALPSYTNLVAVGGDYDRTIGAVSASVTSAATAGAADAVNNTVYANMAVQAMPAITATVSVSGDLSLLTATAGALPLVVNTAKTSTATASDVAVAPTDITVVKNADAATTPVTAPQSFTATVTPVLATNSLVTTPAAVTGALETIGQQGTSFIAPWVQSTNANYNTVIRVSNSGTAVAGVRLSLSSPVGTATATQCTSAELPKLASIPANGELAISSADLTTCFGAFTRGDVRVTIPALTSSLTAKLRIVNPGNIVAEQSLGAIAFDVAKTQ